MFSFNILAYFLLGIKVQFNPCEFIILLKIFWVFPGGKVRPGRAAYHSPPSSAAVMEE